MNNKKAIEGFENEKDFVKKLNSNKSHKYWKILVKNNNKDLFFIRIKGQKLCIPINKKISPKADVYIAKINISKNELLKKNFYLEENGKLDVSKFIPQTGISIKMRNTNYQIDKCSVDKFFYRFHSRELFAGATIYSKNVVDFKKNHKKLISSETNWKKMAEYFSKQELKDIDENTEFNEHHKRIFKLIQKFSYHKIKAETLKSTKILNSLYKGIEEFDEPYCAHWLLINDSLTQKIPKDITVTKGSTHGGEIDPTVVFKPKLS